MRALNPERLEVTGKRQRGNGALPIERREICERRDRVQMP